ncbi:MAG: stage II sporulation protein M [Rhodothermales bacterium]
MKKKSQYDSDELAAMFTQVLDDLSYAKTFYPDSKTTVYLQGLAAQAHQRIYKNKQEEKGRILHFWKEELPRVVRSAHKELFVALVIFLVAISLGAVSSKYDAGFVRLILGDTYVNQTLENIKKDDPMAVYKSMQQWDMFLAITVNNIRVSFFAFSLGIFFSFGTGYVLFSNGVMVGAFQYMFYEKGLLWDALLTIYIHGALELSAIVIAGGAGIVMGNSFLFPGTYSRLESFIRGARRGAKIIVGLIPIFITAGFLEAFVTRHTDMPLWLSLFIIFSSFGLIVWYFIIYPIRKKQEVVYVNK